MGIRAYLHDRLFSRRTVPDMTSFPEKKSGEELRNALLRCETLTEEEVNEYIAYMYEDVVIEEVPLDYELRHPEASVRCLYADNLVQEKWIERHKNQISKETLEKVQRVLPLLYLHWGADSDKS